MRVLGQDSGGETGTPMPDGRIAGPAAWYGPDLEKSDSWIHCITEAEQAELDAALALVAVREISTIRKADFPLPTFGATLERLRQDVLRGRGFVLLRGLPMERYTFEEAARVYWGIGMHFGLPLPQNGKGHLLGHIADLSRSGADVTARTYQTTERQLYHTDSCDIVSLLCVQKAKSGGYSSLVSSVTIFNEMLQRRPDLAAQLSRPYQTDRREEVPPRQRPFYSVPIFNWHDSMFTAQYTRRYVESFSGGRPVFADPDGGDRYAGRAGQRPGAAPAYGLRAGRHAVRP